MGAGAALPCSHRLCAGGKGAGVAGHPELRRAFAAALQPEQSLLLGEERGLLRFTEQTAQELADAARSMWEDVTATPETARTRHSQPSPPAYASEEAMSRRLPSLLSAARAA